MAQVFKNENQVPKLAPEEESTRHYAQVSALVSLFFY